MLEGAAGVFELESHSEPAEPAIDVKTLHAKIGELTLVNDFCPGRSANQGSQFTSMAFTSVPQREKIAISMDGRGAWRDNVSVERLWRSVKYEEATCEPMA